MFGIRRGDSILCYLGSDLYSFRSAGRVRNPIMKKTGHSIDLLLQQITTKYEIYDAVVFEFTKEQEAEFLFRKLSGK